MKITRLKNVIFTAGIAVFTGVLLLGVNAAIGVNTPTAEPPGLGVSPTFTGLNVNGNVQNSAGDLAVSDNLAVTGNLAITGTSNLQGDVTVGGTIYSDEDTLLIDDMLRVGDGLLVDGPGSRIDGDYINVNAVLRANNSIINMADGGADPVLINDNLAVTGTSDLRGNVSDSGGDFTVSDNMTVTGNQQVDGNLTVRNDANMNGNFTVGASDPSTARSITLNGNTSIKFNTLMSGDLDLRGGLKNDYVFADPVKGNVEFALGIDDDVNITGDVSVSGAAKASRFGTYAATTTTFTMLPAEGISWKYFSKACPAGQILVSCGGGRSWGALTFGELYPGNNNTCYLSIHRDNTGFYAYADIVTMCLDPDA